jgi:hypothetical protein
MICARSARALAGVLAAGILAVGPSATAVASNAPLGRAASACGDIGSGGLGVQDIRTSGVGCTTARAVARRWSHSGCTPATDPGGPRTTTCAVKGYTCRAKTPLTSQVIPVRCTRGSAVIKFKDAVA